ncbi:MAG TPA: glyoxalase superfamily protein [Caulobacteraceae bacterium]|nr:glyoxalase superfamily protein [Caulobacteraceae bacterium]
MSDHWYARPLVFVRDVLAARCFYVDKLGFVESWRYAEADEVLIVQVERSGCELILTEQWPDRAGSAVVFVSLDPEVQGKVLAAIEAAGASLTDGFWGYELKIATDPDGNQLWFSLAAS